MGKYLDMIRQEEAQKPTESIVDPVGGENTPRTEALAPGNAITWGGADGKQRGSAVIDYLHKDAGGTNWAFVTLPDKGWAAVNLKYATVQERDRKERT